MKCRGRTLCAAAEELCAAQARTKAPNARGCVSIAAAAPAAAHKPHRERRRVRQRLQRCIEEAGVPPVPESCAALRRHRPLRIWKRQGAGPAAACCSVTHLHRLGGREQLRRRRRRRQGRRHSNRRRRRQRQRLDESPGTRQKPAAVHRNCRRAPARAGQRAARRSTPPEAQKKR